MNKTLTTRLNVQPTIPAGRRTPPSKAERFRHVLGSVVQTAVSTTAAIVPGGGALQRATLALSPQELSQSAPRIGTSRAGLSGVSSATASLGTSGGSEVSSGSEQAELLELQHSMYAEQQKFTMLSNLMKSRHDTAKSVISNIS